MGAAEDEDAGLRPAAAASASEFGEVDADDLGGDGVDRVQPSSTKGTRRGQAFSSARRPRAWQAAV